MGQEARSVLDEGPETGGSTLTRALRAGRRRLWQEQSADGSWSAACDLGPACTAYVLTTLAFVNKLAADDARQACRWLRGQQNPDGSFAGRPFARQGDVGATAAVWAALHATALPDNREAMAKARAYVEGRGGFGALVRLFYEGDPAAVFLAMAGLLPAGAIEEITPNILMNTAPGASLFTRKVSVILPWRGLVFGVVLRGLAQQRGIGNPLQRLADRVLRDREWERCLASLERTGNPDGSWLYGDTLHASLALAALHTMGLGASERMTRGLTWLGRQKLSDAAGLRFPIFQSDVWTTAFALRALVAGGTRPGRLGVSRAARWLMDCQHDGSWAFQQHNTAMPDSDDVGVVLATLAETRRRGQGAQPFRSLDARLDRSMSQAVTWLRGMQNADGGWPSFQKDLPGKPAGPIMTRPLSLQSLFMKLRLAIDPPVDAGDPATEDVTGRVLFGLGKAGVRLGDPAVDRGIGFLRAQQWTNGGWWGRWVVNYLAATAWVLRGAAAVGVRGDEAWIRKGIEFIQSHQRQDGGWGEDVASYSNPSQAGEAAASTPGLTGLVLSALCECGQGQSPQAARAAQYLQRTQLPDGGWPNGELVHCLVPPTLFYVLPGAELQLPLEGLGRYAQQAGAGQPDLIDETIAIDGSKRRRRTVADFRLLLDKARFQSDAAADPAVQAVKQAGLTQVAPVLANLTRNRDLIPPGLPAPLTALFDDTAQPAWADPVRIKRAQDLFQRCGWATAMTLFASSLPQCYACADGAKILVYTEELRKNPQRRILETAQFVFDVTAPGAFGAGGRGLRSAQKVRLLHALIRALVHEKPDVWDPAKGAPISQFFLAGTLMTFSAAVIDGMRTMELEVGDPDADAWIHLWNVVGFHLGVDEALLPADNSEAESLLEAVRELSWAPSEAGNLLAKATLAVMQDKLLAGKLMDGVAVMLVRQLAGDSCADLLGLPASDWTADLWKPFALTMDLFEVQGTSPLAVLLRHASMQLMFDLQDIYLGKHRPEFETLETQRLVDLWKQTFGQAVR